MRQRGRRAFSCCVVGKDPALVADDRESEERGPSHRAVRHADCRRAVEAARRQPGAAAVSRWLRMTRLLYRDEPDRLEFHAAVVGRRERQGRSAVILDQTAFFPEGGGQPCDTGDLGQARVLAVVEEAGELLHVLDTPAVQDRVHGRVDAVRRRDHTQQHHGQHLLSRAFVEVAGAVTVGFHLGAEATSIDLDREVTESEVRASEIRCNEVVWEARPVAVRTVGREEAEELGLRAAVGAGDRVRLVQVEGFDVQACSGTHPRSTAAVGLVLVLTHERYKGGTRVHFVCGHRALEASRQRNAIVGRLGALFSAAPANLADAGARALSRLQETERRCRTLLARSLEAEARRLLAAASGSPVLVTGIYDAWPLEELRGLALKLTSLAPCVALVAGRGEAAHLVFAQSAGLGFDIPALLGEATRWIEGRGGGRGDLAQGAGNRVEGLQQALDHAAAIVRDRQGGQGT